MSSRFSIATPCPKKWTELQGEGRERYCDVCRKSVRALDQYSQAELDQVWRESDGHVCGLLSEESPPEHRTRRAVMVGALLTAISPLMAQMGRVRIRVTDVTEAVLPGAVVSLLGSDDKVMRTAQTDGVGEIVLTDLPMGDSRFTIAAPGFKTRALTVTIRNGDEVKIEAVLDVGPTNMGVIVEEVPVKPKRRPWRISPLG
ncbi:MAG: carboxypeptidase-like regulatory domain-containing protein [Acidobacteriota bacterium]|nr:carboxypeptidase-like regulatory domain-containing protein [Acidobacteriota bacterium]